MTNYTNHREKVVIIKSLLNAFHQEEILYCHWKSNEHLEASMTADTDLDILFDEKQKKNLVILLNKLGFKKFNSITQKQYRDIEDFVGLDVISGKVVHLHAHFKLTLGEAFLKSYQLNFTGQVLDSRVFDNTFDIWIINPSFELILLYLREALKIRNRDIIKMIIKNKANYTGNILNEYMWLKNQTTDLGIENILKSIFNNYKAVYDLVTGPFDRRKILKLSRLIKKEFKKYRLYSATHALVLRWYREASVKIYKKSALFFNRPIVSHRINPRGGLIVAVIGADGSGKSSIVANLYSTFCKKLDVYQIYFGRGDGKISWARQILSDFKKKIVPVQPGKPGLNLKQNTAVKRKGAFANIYKCLLALLVANEKKKNLKLMVAAKKKGMLVICDRFPQNQIMGYNDGPLLNHLSKSHNLVLRAIAKFEAKVYAEAERNPSDLLFKLIANADIVGARKPNETSREKLEAKIEGFKKLKFSENCNVVNVDAAQPLKEVLSIIKRELWDVYK